ncbi:MAG: fatty acid desaturase [Lacunisphaera sp.]
MWTAFALYVLRMFAVTGIFHRYFSHKTYSTSRFGQFLLALWTGTTVQRGALWWAYHHRHHHQHSDEEEDAHSPHVHGFWWSHIGWITSKRNFPTDYSKVKDLAKYPELVWLNRFDIVVPVLFATSLFVLGRILETAAPGLHTTGAQLLVWGFFISTTALFHGTASINSFTHLWGKRRFKTTDDSRNSFILAIVCLGEGWHNITTAISVRHAQWFLLVGNRSDLLRPEAAVLDRLHLGPEARPAIIYEEAAQNAHQDTVHRFSVSSVQHEINTLRKVVPTAAAIAIATVNTPGVADQLKKKDGPAMHKDETEQVEGNQPGDTSRA